MTAEIIKFDEQRERRRYIALAHASENWQQIKASMAISGFELTDDNAERIGRMIDSSLRSSDESKSIGG